MKLILFIAAAAALAAPQTAQACRGVHAHRYVVLRDPPARLPAGATLIKVRLIGRQVYDGRVFVQGVPARILAGRGAGRTVRLRPQIWTSCSVWFEGSEVGYVVGWPEGPRANPRAFEVVEYRARQYREPDEENSVGYVRAERNSR